MRSVRLSEELEARLREAARITGKPASAIIRDAIERYCDGLMEQRLDLRLADVIGVVHSEGGRARSTGKASQERLHERREEGSA